METIVPGVHVLSLEFETEEGTRALHPTAVETSSGLTLVDAGMPDHPNTIERELDDIGTGIEDIDRILLTHQDFDHAGGLADVRARSDAPTFAHTVDAPYIRGERELIKSPSGSYPGASVDVELTGGVTFDTVAGPAHVIETPGHTPGHVSLHIPQERVLIAGDALVAQDGLVGPLERATPDMPTALDSVGRLADLAVEHTVCYHGGPVVHDADRIATLHAELRES